MQAKPTLGRVHTMATEQQIKDLMSLYIGYFDRAADPEGLQFWIDQIDGGRPFETIAQDFATSNEATSIYPFLADPDGEDPTEFIVTIYQNLFNRDPDAGGLQFWSNVLAEGSVPVGDFIEEIIKGAQDTIVEGELILDRSTLANKIEVGQYWTDSAINTPDFVFNEAAYESAQAVVQGVTSDPATVQAAEAQADTFFAGLLPSTTHT